MSDHLHATSVKEVVGNEKMPMGGDRIIEF